MRSPAEGTMALPGATAAKPRNMKVRTNDTENNKDKGRFLSKILQRQSDFSHLFS